MSAPAGRKKGKDAEPAIMKQFITPVVTDEEGRRLTRTMRSTDKLQDLMRFYYAMVHPAVEDGQGVFLHHGRRLHYQQTPASCGMKDGDEIQFLPEIEPRMFVTPVLSDFRGRKFTRTVRRTDTVQSLMDYYHAMVPTVPYNWAVFLLDGIRVTGEETMVDLELEDGDQIDVLRKQPSVMWASSPR